VKTLFFTAHEWNRFAWNMQEVLCIRYNVILTDHKTTKEKTMSVLNKINIKNFNKGITTFVKSLNNFCKTIDSFTANTTRKNFKVSNQWKNTSHAFGRVTPISKDEIWGNNTNSISLWGKPIGFSNHRVNMWPEKQLQNQERETDTGIQ
jgi:hypothetical protein